MGQQPQGLHRLHAAGVTTDAIYNRRDGWPTVFWENEDPQVADCNAKGAEMTIEFNCPQCKAAIAFPDRHAGKRAMRLFYKHYACYFAR